MEEKQIQIPDVNADAEERDNYTLIQETPEDNLSGESGIAIRYSKDFNIVQANELLRSKQSDLTLMESKLIRLAVSQIMKGDKDLRTYKVNVSQLAEFLEENPAVGKAILDKAMMANRAREAARKAREAIRRKTGLESGQMPDKLRDCNDTDPTLTEIYIVEGDSAGGSATQGRDSRFQAILPLWGKMLNVEKARADKVYGNDKLQPVITALGAGIGDEFNLDKLRYHKVIIMADADVDGSHIRTLLLTFFFRFMRPLIEHGYVYSAVPPLYKLSRGKTQRVAYSDPERDRISAEMRADNPNAKIDISRYKGLGEMNPHELWETTMDPTTRTLRRITLEDAVQADQIFTVLMGEDVEPRKEFIEENAKYVVNLDI